MRTAMSKYLLKQLLSTIFILISATIFQVRCGEKAAKIRAELKVSPEGEVMFAQSITLTCRLVHLDPDTADAYAYEKIFLLFGGASEHMAMVKGPMLTYPSTSKARPLLFSACVDFHDPNVTICNQKQALSVSFFAVPGLDGTVTCGILKMGEVFAPALGKIKITNVFLQVQPPEPDVGERVNVSCTFDNFEKKHTVATTGFTNWTKLRDVYYSRGTHVFRQKLAWRVLTSADMGRNITCSLGAEKKSKTFRFRYGNNTAARIGEASLPLQAAAAFAILNFLASSLT